MNLLPRLNRFACERVYQVTVKVEGAVFSLDQEFAAAVAQQLVVGHLNFKDCLEREEISAVHGWPRC